MPPKVNLGTAAWADVELDVNEVATILTSFVDRGSKLNTVSVDDPDTAVLTGADPTRMTNVIECLGAGMKLFDAIVWLKSNKQKALTTSMSLTAETVPKLAEVARAVFYVYFFLLTQARYPNVGTKNQIDQTPAFLTKILGMNEGQKHYAELICGFEINKFNPQWIKYYKSTRLGQEAISRFGLGVAGYRLCAPFKHQVPDAPDAEKYKDAIAFAAYIATSPANWAIHPVTRDPSFLTAVGNFNNNLNNLILQVYKEETIKEMVKIKVLYQHPVRDIRAKEYTTWSLQTYTLTGEEIFTRTS